MTFASRVDAETAKQELTVTHPSLSLLLSLTSSGRPFRSRPSCNASTRVCQIQYESSETEKSESNVSSNCTSTIYSDSTYEYSLSPVVQSLRHVCVRFVFLEELGAAFFPTEAWGQPLTFDLATGSLHHPAALLHAAGLHPPAMVCEKISSFRRCNWTRSLSLSIDWMFFKCLSFAC